MQSRSRSTGQSLLLLASLKIYVPPLYDLSFDSTFLISQPLRNGLLADEGNVIKIPKLSDR